MATQLAVQRNFITITPSNQIAASTVQSTQTTMTTSPNEDNDLVTITTAAAGSHTTQTETSTVQLLQVISASFVCFFLAEHKMTERKMFHISFHRKNIFFRRRPKVFRSLTSHQLNNQIQRMRRQSMCRQFCQQIHQLRRPTVRIRSRSQLRWPLFKRQTLTKTPSHTLSPSMVSENLQKNPNFSFDISEKFRFELMCSVCAYRMHVNYDILPSIFWIKRGLSSLEIISRNNCYLVSVKSNENLSISFSDYSRTARPLRSSHSPHSNDGKSSTRNE